MVSRNIAPIRSFCFSASSPSPSFILSPTPSSPSSPQMAEYRQPGWMAPFRHQDDGFDSEPESRPGFGRIPSYAQHPPSQRVFTSLPSFSDLPAMGSLHPPAFPSTSSPASSVPTPSSRMRPGYGSGSGLSSLSSSAAAGSSYPLPPVYGLYSSSQSNRQRAPGRSSSHILAPNLPATPDDGYNPYSTRYTGSGPFYSGSPCSPHNAANTTAPGFESGLRPYDVYHFSANQQPHHQHHQNPPTPPYRCQPIRTESDSALLRRMPPTVAFSPLGPGGYSDNRRGISVNNLLNHDTDPEMSDRPSKRVRSSRMTVCTAGLGSEPVSSVPLYSGITPIPTRGGSSTSLCLPIPPGLSPSPSPCSPGAGSNFESGSGSGLGPGPSSQERKRKHEQHNRRELTSSIGRIEAILVRFDESFDPQRLQGHNQKKSGLRFKKAETLEVACTQLEGSHLLANQVEKLFVAPEVLEQWRREGITRFSEGYNIRLIEAITRRLQQ